MERLTIKYSGFTSESMFNKLIAHLLKDHEKSSKVSIVSPFSKEKEEKEETDITKDWEAQITLENNVVGKIKFTIDSTGMPKLEFEFDENVKNEPDIKILTERIKRIRFKIDLVMLV